MATKKCPFCAEEIQAEAIKCRFCQSFVSAAPSGASEGGPGAGGTPVDEAPTGRPSGGRAPFDRDNAEPVDKAGSALAPSARPTREYLFAGSPSWRAFFRAYFLIVVGGLFVPLFMYWLVGAFNAGTMTKFLAVVIPLAMGTVALFAMNLFRKSLVFRISTTNIETERGIISKKIDVLELWRCRDVRYRQSFLDRILGVSHIDVFTADVTTPQLEIIGMPASRQLFERIRDSIEIQRQSNVYGVVQ